MRLVSFSLGALALGGAIALVGCSPSNSNNAATDNSAPANAAQTNTTTTPTPTDSPVIAPTKASDALPASALANIWVPGADDKLHLRPVSKAAMQAQGKFKDPTAALNEIVQTVPSYYPPQTQVMDWHDDGKTVSVNLNKNFLNSAFWAKRGELSTRLAVYALVNSAASGKPVVLEVEKKPLADGAAVGELDVSGPIEANKTLEASASSSATALEGQSKAP